MTQTKKHHYVKPSMKVYPLPSSTRLLAGSESIPIDPSKPTTNQW